MRISCFMTWIMSIFVQFWCLMGIRWWRMWSINLFWTTWICPYQLGMSPCFCFRNLRRTISEFRVIVVAFSPGFGIVVKWDASLSIHENSSLRVTALFWRLATGVLEWEVRWEANHRWRCRFISKAGKGKENKSVIINVYFADPSRSEINPSPLLGNRFFGSQINHTFFYGNLLVIREK